MEDPVRDIPHVVQLLVTAPPSVQRDTIQKYFTPDAAFTHPLCRTGSWGQSRLLIEYVYRWYKIMSPTIDLEFDSIAYDPQTLTLFLNMHQHFRIWFLPGWHCPVALTTVLSLRRLVYPGSATKSNEHRFLIAHQNDLYQTDQWIKFLVPWGIGCTLVWFWTFLATLGCMLCAILGLPVTHWEENTQGGQKDVWLKAAMALQPDIKDS